MKKILTYLLPLIAIALFCAALVNYLNKADVMAIVELVVGLAVTGLAAWLILKR